MNLKGRRIRATSYKHCLKVAPPREKDILNLTKRLRNGDCSVIHRIVVGHMAIAMQIVGRYVTVKGRFDDEWVSVAFLAVVQAVKRAQHTLINDNITPYIISAVHSALSEFMAEDRVIPIPYSTLRRNKLQPPTITNKGDAEIFSHEKQIVARELLESACITPVDRKIIDMRVRGYTDSDIAKAIGISRQYVQTIRAKLEKRIKELYEL